LCLFLRISLAYCQSASPTAPKTAAPARYTFLLAGNKAGFESSTRNADGSWQIHYEFNDRGRGPSIDERIVAGKDGMPTEIEIKDGGQSRTVIQYAISGLGFAHFPVWLESDGTFFASASTWSSIVSEGWESIIADLIKEQDKFDNERSKTLAHTLGRKPKGPLVLVHANLFDAESAQVLPNRTIVVTGTRTSAVGADGTIKPPANAEIVDAAGKTLLPGLWDMHVHVQPGDGLLHMACGVTSV